MTTDFSDISESQARAYRDHVVAREHARLGDLARLMVHTDGPIDVMDASLDSLVPLWEWFIKFVRTGYPALTGNPWQSEAFAFGRTAGAREGAGRLYYSAEMLEHYILRTVQRIFSNAHWDVHIQKRSRVADAHQHRTGIRFGDGEFRQIDNSVALIARRMNSEDQDVLNSDRLKNLVMLTFGWALETPTQSLGPSILTPYLSLPPVPLDDPRRQPPLFDLEVEVEVEVEVRAPSVGEELVFAAIGANMESLESAPPLDAGSVATVLTELGFAAPNGSAVSSEDLTATEQQQLELGEVAMIETLAPGGRLAGFMLEPTGATEAEWNTIVTSLNGLGLKIGARLAPGREF